MCTRTLFSLVTLLQSMGCAPHLIDNNEENGNDSEADPNPTPINDWGITDVDEISAQKIAQGFILQLAESKKRPEWENGFAGEPTPLFSLDGILQAYEVPVFNANQEAQGWVIVEAWDFLDPVSSYTSEGDSGTRLLSEEFSISNEHAVFLWIGPGSLSLLDKSSGEIFSDLPENTSLSFDGIKRLEMADAADNYYNETDNYSVSDEKAELRKAYLSQNFTSTLFVGKHVTIENFSNEQRGVDVGSGAVDFSNFVQEKLWWDNDAAGIYYCKTGCAPIAWAIVMDYWDRNGYPGLISTTSDQSHTYNDLNVRWTLDELRYEMKTKCSSSGGEAGTSSGLLPNALKHINTRGEGSWTGSYTATTDPTSTKWTNYKKEIDAGRPALISYDMDHLGGSADHVVAAYEYTDNAGTTNDWICAERGTKTSGTTWDCFTPAQAGPYAVTTADNP